MDNQGWVKLHRSILDNKDLAGKNYDFGIFTYLILKADRNTGTARVGRLQIAKYFRASESTIYKAVKRLERGMFINIKSNNQYSDMHICNYDKYQTQSNSESNNKVTTKEQQSNTIQEDKKKEVKNNHRESGLEFSLRDDLPLEKIQEISHDKLISVKKVEEYKQNYIDWIMASPKKKECQNRVMSRTVMSWLNRDIGKGLLQQRKNIWEQLKDSGLKSSEELYA